MVPGEQPIEQLTAGDLKGGVFHLRSLTGLRFVAAFAVFYSHVQHFLFPESRLVPLGGPAVSFFFVLSGFILTYVYAERLREHGVRRFWFTRWARLWPLHVVCFLIAIWFLYDPPGSQPNGRNSFPSMTAQFLMLHAWIPVNHWFTDFNSVSWSISTEAFFYLVFPVLLLGNRKWFALKLFLTFLTTFLFLAWFQHLVQSRTAPEWLDVLGSVIAFPLVRLSEFALGMATCLLMQGMKKPFASQVASNRARYLVDSLWELFAVALIVISWSIMVQSRFTNFLVQSPDFGFLFATWVRIASGMFFYAFLIFVFSSRRGFLGQMMASRLGVWLGEISFSFYLIHQIVIMRLNFMAMGDLQFAFFSFFIALFSAGLLYRVVEMPFRNALLCVYDRKSGCFTKWTEGLKQVFSSRTGNFQAVALVILIGLVWIRPVDDVNRNACQEIVSQTDPHLINVVFHEEATMMGMNWERVERGLKIRMAWKRTRNWSRKRFLHICDAQGNVIGQGPLEELVFRVHKPNQPFFEEVVLHKRRIKNAAYIAVGFWSEEDECALVEDREADMGGFRVKIIDLNDWRRSD